jgi:hypothetical protein
MKQIEMQYEIYVMEQTEHREIFFLTVAKW